MRIALIFLITYLPLITVYSIIMTLAVIRRGKLIRGLNEPELWLPKDERAEHARKLLRREDEQYENQQLEKYTQIIRGQG